MKIEAGRRQGRVKEQELAPAPHRREERMRVLVLGASGMLGNAMIRVLGSQTTWDVHGSIRSAATKRFFSPEIAERLVVVGGLENHDNLVEMFCRLRPQVVINCIGLVKQLGAAADPFSALPINSLLPHRLVRLCEASGARLVHVSTDCVFSGRQGNYREEDLADAADVYGKSKFLGEVAGPHAITLRTSMIGHELASAHGLVDWFLAQQGQCKGFVRSIFSGLPTVVLARIIRDIIIPRPDLCGIYHVAAQPISKYDLLRLVAAIYGKVIEIVPDEQLQVDRSLNAERFRAATDYVAPGWLELVRVMHEDFMAATLRREAADG